MNRLLAASTLVVSLTALVLGCDEGGQSVPEETAAATRTGVASVSEESPEPEPFVVDGKGRTDQAIEIPSTLEPLVLTASYPTGDLLSVNVQGPGFRRLEGQRGGFVFDDPGSGETATPGVDSGSYRLVVKGTKGAWALTFSEPNPDIAPIELPEAIQGTGDLVGKLHLANATAMAWEIASEGPYVSGHLLGYNEAEGAEQFLGILQGGLVFEPGKNGLKTDDVLPAGDYLIVVDADADWGFRFTSTE
jgi:hypothetical protein